MKHILKYNNIYKLSQSLNYMVLIDFMNKTQTKKFIIEEVRKSNEYYHKDINQLRERILKLEETIRVFDKILNLRGQKQLKGGKEK